MFNAFPLILNRSGDLPQQKLGKCFHCIGVFLYLYPAFEGSCSCSYSGSCSRAGFCSYFCCISRTCSCHCCCSRFFSCSCSYSHSCSKGILNLETLPPISVYPFKGRDDFWKIRPNLFFIKGGSLTKGEAITLVSTTWGLYVPVRRKHQPMQIVVQQRTTPPITQIFIMKYVM